MIDTTKITRSEANGWCRNRGNSGYLRVGVIAIVQITTRCISHRELVAAPGIGQYIVGKLTPRAKYYLVGCVG